MIRRLNRGSVDQDEIFQNRCEIEGKTDVFRPIRVDHTNCLQVVIKTHSFRIETKIYSINLRDVFPLQTGVYSQWLEGEGVIGKLCTHDTGTGDGVSSTLLLGVRETEIIDASLTSESKNEHVTSGLVGLLTQVKNMR